MLLRMYTPPSMRTHQGGFTLIELMIVVVIIGILAGFGYPAYQDYARKGRRSDGQAVLMKLAAQQEQFYAKNMRYALDFADLGAGAGASTTGLSAHYRVDLSDPSGLNDGTQYLLTAVPVSPAQSSDVCANLTVNNLGTKGTSSTRTDCWK